MNDMISFKEGSLYVSCLMILTTNALGTLKKVKNLKTKTFRI